MKLVRKCPNCGGILERNEDEKEIYLTCLMCAREFDLNMKPRSMTPEELTSRYGIKITEGKGWR